MGLTCTFKPERNGVPLEGWKTYKDVLGYNVASRVFTASIAPEYIERFAKILVLDNQGVPTLESTLRTPVMKKFVPEQKQIEALEKKYGFKEVDNTAENFKVLLSEAKNFNSNENDYTALVVRTPHGLRVSVQNRTSKNVEIFNNQYGSMMLNERLVSMFGPLGVTIGELEAIEMNSDGVVDFSKAKLVAGQFKDLIRISQGMEGQIALSEEFSHLIVRCIIDNPIVQRLIKAYSRNPETMHEILGEEYDTYVKRYADEEGNPDYETMAEECVGRKLRDSLMNNTMDKEEGFFDKLIRRVRDFLLSFFRRFNSEELGNAIIDADQTIDDLAKNILKGNVDITQADIEKTRTDKILHHFDTKVKTLDDIIENAIITEAKKASIIHNEKILDRIDKRKAILQAIQDETPEGQLKGLINYTRTAKEDIAETLNQLMKMSMQDNGAFAVLRAARMVLQSYTPFLEQLGKLLNTQEEDLKKLVESTSIENSAKVVETIHSVFDGLSGVHSLLKGKFTTMALDAFENFLKPFYEDEVFLDSNGKKITLRQAIEIADGDISFFDRWLQTMSTSDDPLLQLFNAVVSKSKNKARQQTIKDIREIMKLQQEFEENGISDNEWVFELDREGHKTGNYISEINYGQYRKDYNEMLDRLDEKYGKTPSLAKLKEKEAEKRKWLLTHAESVFKPESPKASVYRNHDYFNKLSNKQRELLKKYTDLKEKFDKRYPPNRITKNLAIQRGKTQTERRTAFLKSPEEWYKSTVEGIKKDFLENAEDDQKFGQRTALRDFSGKEHMVLPVLYSRRLKNPDDLSTDIFGALSAYSYASNVYHQLDDVVDPLEIGRALVEDKTRKVATSKGNKPLVEKLRGASGMLARVFQTGSSNIEDKLQDFMESQVYQRYYKDSDDVWKVGNANIKGNKVLNKFLSISSVAQLGFNWCANAANIATGIGMQNIEAAAGQFFNAKELWKADVEYTKQLKDFLPELESRDKTSKLALFDEMFDVRQDFRDKAGRSRVNSFLKRVFGETVCFLGQTCGDHWLYNRTAIAMAIRTKVIVGDKEMSLWDALKVEGENSKDDKVKVLRLPDGTKDAVTGKIIDEDWIGQWSESIKYVNHRLFGVYNSDDMVAAERTAQGRMLLQFRKWIVPQMAARFDKRKHIMAIHSDVEGYYRTLFNFLIGLKNGQGNMLKQWRNLETWQKQNIVRCIAELVQFGAVWALATFLVGHNDDPESFWNNKYLEYMCQRELHELGNLAPSLIMGNEILKTVQSPIAAISSAQSALNLVGSLVDPRDWMNELQSGPYEGHSTLYKHIMKAPLPILPQIRQMDRFLNNIDDATLYYTRSY